MVSSLHAIKPADMVSTLFPPAASHDNRSENGGAIWLLFVAIALFGAMSYAFLQGSRNNLAMITDEATKTAMHQSQDCSNSVALATKRLQARGCGNVISMETDGSNPHAGAPTDGSCSVYHPAGGGAKPCTAVVIAPPDPCTTGPVNTVCTSDGAIYIGERLGDRIYVRPTNSATVVAFSTGQENTPVDNMDGLSNTDALMALHGSGPYSYPAAAACRAHGPQWYLPVVGDFHLLSTADQDIVGVTGTEQFLVATQNGITSTWRVRIIGYDSTSANSMLKTFVHPNSAVRCFRR